MNLSICEKCARQKEKENRFDFAFVKKKKEKKIYTINVKPNENKYIFYSLLSAIALYLQFDVVCVYWIGWSSEGFALMLTTMVIFNTISVLLLLLWLPLFNFVWACVSTENIVCILDILPTNTPFYFFSFLGFYHFIVFAPMLFFCCVFVLFHSHPLFRFLGLFLWFKRENQIHQNQFHHCQLM